MRTIPRLLSALLFLACASPSIARPKVDQLPPSTRVVLDNGLEAILIPNGTAPLITSVAVVRTGSARETPDINGVSHMLEHLLFSGTARRTQKDIAAAEGRFGLVNNAHTAAEHTAYFVLAAREQFAEALDLQADMLLGSTIPEERLVQERDIIANEIAKDQVQDETMLSELYAARLYPGGLSLPVIGTPATVRSIPRDAVMAAYRSWYVPNNMTLVIMGDFRIDEMEALVSRLFGRAAPGVLPSPPKQAPVPNAAALGRMHTVKTSGAARRLWMGAPSPGMQDAAFPAHRMLSLLLDKGLVNAVNARLSSAGRTGSLLEAVAGLDTYARLGTLQVRGVLDAAVSWDDAAQALREEVLDRLARTPWTSRDLDGLRLEEKASLLRLWEKPHYFGLDRAPYVAGGGWDLARDMARSLSWVELSDVKDAGKRLASADRWALFAAGPEVPADEGASAVTAQAAPAPPADSGRPTPGSRDLVQAWKERPAAPAGPLPALTGRAPGAGGGRGEPVVRTYLPNGLMVILDSSDDSRVFAAHVLARDRVLWEPAGRNGLAELLHGMISFAGTRTYPAEALPDALRRIGGSLKTQDDPAIPYDDIYLSPEYSYIRLEALDEFAGDAIDLLRGLLAEPALDNERAFTTARDNLLARARRSATSPRDRARLALARSLWGDGHPLATSPFGTEAGVSSLTLEDVRAFHASYFAPKNLIVAIGTSLPPEVILPLLEAKLGRWNLQGTFPRVAASMPAPAGSPPSGAGAEAPRAVIEALAGPQSYVAWGRLAPAADAATLSALAAVLGSRMSDVLREQRGLAYSLGAEASPLGGMVQITAGMGVLPEKVDDAREGLREMVLSLHAKPPSQDELDGVSRDTNVRSLMRGLSRINRAWRRCVDEMRRGSEAAKSTAASPSGPPVEADRAAALARSLVDPSALSPWVEAVVGRGPAEKP